jgi:hypothetical protein
VLQAAYEVAELSSPIVGRSHIQPELDELEEYVMDAI